jgi:hypothetical protein
MMALLIKTTWLQFLPSLPYFLADVNIGVSSLAGSLVICSIQDVSKFQNFKSNQVALPSFSGSLLSSVVWRLLMMTMLFGGIEESSF